MRRLFRFFTISASARYHYQKYESGFQRHGDYHTVKCECAFNKRRTDPIGTCLPRLRSDPLVTRFLDNLPFHVIRDWNIQDLQDRRC